MPLIEPFEHERDPHAEALIQARSELAKAENSVRAARYEQAKARVWVAILEAGGPELDDPA